ncbi:L,D-transpeptidase family protein [Hephaestia mangrovi]|uniref:L,D-transpeptidase family protein n=1 Tax=Hephaestia mangrovi TaxID=2873268 RepID=UPI001CA636CC|nr:L,D-transpeptidase family protein [Hephaestia mangrovi]MBY8828281.1 L,D-transpeptidase family protein [Hephaestia mangrovi]
MPRIAAAALLLASIAAPAAAQAPAASPQQGIDMGVLHVQVILDHLGFSPGVLDGKKGMSLTAAIKGFQESRDLKQTGEVDAATLAALKPYEGWTPTKTLVLSRQALAGPYINPIPHGEDKQAKLPGLYYRSPMEKLAEMFHTTPETLMALNSPSTPLTPGTRVVFPNALPTSRDYPDDLPQHWRDTLNMLNVDANEPQAAKIVVDKSEKVLKVYDDQGKLVRQFQVTTGSTHDPLPIGHWKINAADYNPKFHYNPALFWDAKSSDTKAMLPPGPNGPVGVVWLDLSKEHYGIHGTSEPQLIGRTESHGCVRLTNWNAARLALMVKPGTPVVFQE